MLSRALREDYGQKGLVIGKATPCRLYSAARHTFAHSETRQSQTSSDALTACLTAKSTTLAIDCCEAFSRRTRPRQSNRTWKGSI